MLIQDVMRKEKSPNTCDW